MTAHVALLGHPVAHSLSPRFQNAALRAAGIPLVYEAIDVPPQSLHRTLAELGEINAAGNVAATTVSAVQPATLRTLSMTLTAGNYRFTVQAINAVGAGPQSARSNLVAAR